MKNALILLAGGQGKRLKSKKPKQFLKIGNTNLIEYFLFSGIGIDELQLPKYSLTSFFMYI